MGLSDDAHFKLALSFRIIASSFRAAIDYRNSIKFCGFSTKPCRSESSVLLFHLVLQYFFSNFKIHTRECINKAIESLKVLCYIFRHVQFSCQSTVLIENGLTFFTKSHFNFKGKRGWYFITKLVLTYCEKKMFKCSRRTEFAKFLRSLEQFI